jgi:hypothetical protein
MEHFLTIQDIVKITGKSSNAINKYIKKGKIKSRKSMENGVTAREVEKKEVERFLGHTIEWPVTGEMSKEEISSETKSSEISSKEMLKKTVREILEEEKFLQKPLEEQVIYRIEKLEEIVRNLLEQRELPDKKVHKNRADDECPDNIKHVLMDNAENIKILQKEKESLLNTVKKLDEENRALKSQVDKNNRYSDSIAKTLLESAENLQVLQKEVEALEKEKHRLMRELEIVKFSAEEEKKKISQSWKARLEELSKPWWKNF